MEDLQKLVGSLNKSGALSGFLGGVAGGGLTSLVSGKGSKKTGKKSHKIWRTCSCWRLSVEGLQTILSTN
ncbi:hypothetical protein [Pseudoalteromonas sp.]|uniref:hypothetical protein n=1 Tax=Pseudoalteromonas sp. TaxID=53249 RepID=UPI003003380E